MRADFDRLACLSEDGWDHNAHYHGFLLGQLPRRCRLALDVGCGTGGFARLLAGRCDQVLGIDLALRMVEVARARSRGHPHLDYLVADATTWPFRPARFDCVASIAAAHHLPLVPLLARMADAVAPGGTLLVLDIYRPRSPAQAACARVLPGAGVRRHLLWRCSIVWRRPG